MRELPTEIVINAPAKRVWSLLTDIDRLNAELKKRAEGDTTAPGRASVGLDNKEADK